MPFLVTFPLASAQTSKITTPKQALGFDIGDDYRLASYSMLEAYWKKTDSESDRMRLVDIGMTAEGRRQYMAVLTSAENQKKLDRYKEIARKLALAEGLSDGQARLLASEGKAVVFMDGGRSRRTATAKPDRLDRISSIFPVPC